MNLKFRQILDSTSRLVKGFTYDKMEEALNESMTLFASEFTPAFLVREYFIETTSVDDLGPYTIYEDDEFLIEADIIEPTHHPIKTHISGVVDSNGNRIRFSLLDGQVQLIDTITSYGTYSIWCLKRPKQVILSKIETVDNVPVNYLDMESDFPTYSLQALSHLVAYFLCIYKKDYERAKYFEDKYRLQYAPLAKSKSVGDWGIQNSGESSKADNGSYLEWA